MKKIALKADLSMVSDKHQILVSNIDKVLMVDITGKSALHIPLSQFLKVYGLRKKTVYLNQIIQIRRNGKNLLKINNGKIIIDSYPDTIKFFLSSTFG